MEDRLRAILYHSGVIKQREDKNLDYSSNSKYLTEMFYEYNGNIARKNHNIDFSKIFNKISMVRAILRWERQNTDYISSDYLKKLKIQYKEIDKQYFLKALNDVEKWKNYRNELIHSVLENNIDSINDTLKEKVDEGKQLINQLTELSRLVKKNSFVFNRADGGSEIVTLGCPIVVVDSSTRNLTISKGSREDLKDYEKYGIDADEILIRFEYGIPKEIIVYR
jgi:hypothetical protein